MKIKKSLRRISQKEANFLLEVFKEMVMMNPDWNKEHKLGLIEAKRVQLQRRVR